MFRRDPNSNKQPSQIQNVLTTVNTQQTVVDGAQLETVIQVHT